MQILAARPSRLAVALAVASFLILGGLAPAAETPPTAPAPPKAAASTRAPDASERSAMLDILKAESAPERTAWLSYSAGNAESKALVDALGAVFREAGWKVETSTLSGMILKPGVSFFFAEEEPPSWAESALRAVQASGIDVKSASGYRSYYDEKKKENAAWPGVPIAKDAAFVIVVGPEAKA